MIDTFRGVVPFLMSDAVRVTLIVLFPILSLWLPRVLGADAARRLTGRRLEHIVNMC